MKFHKDITYWENKRRIKALRQFSENVVVYFDNSRYEWREDKTPERAEAKEARRRINFTLDEIREIVRAAGVYAHLHWESFMSVGGHALNVDVLLNLFNLPRLKIPPADAISFLDRSIGVYQSNERPSLMRTFNPFWWLYRLLVWFAHIPFGLFGAAGFNTSRAEQSLVGRLFKVILMIIPVVASLLTILELMGWLDGIKISSSIGA